MQTQFEHVSGNYTLDIQGPKKSLKQYWTINNFEATSAPFILEGMLYISEDGVFYAIDSNTGNTVWEHKIPGQATIPVFHDNMLIFGGSYLDSHVYAL